MKLNWQPTATLEHLHARAKIIADIRHFFAGRGVLEVDTPLMCHTSVTDPFIESIPTLLQSHQKEKRYYLQTSPEYAMKRLLASGYGSIYQICKAFRQEEIGKIHNPEFTMLEWYRIDFDHHQLMDEMDELLQLTLKMQKAERLSYQGVFEKYVNLNPHIATLSELKACATEFHITVASDIEDRDTWLQLLMSHVIEPQLGPEKPCFIYDFPASQAALARLLPDNPSLAARFEVYVKGMELANGFHELQDAEEQRKRFEKNNKERLQMGLSPLLIDEYLLAALQHGLPNCAGVALGIDRLIMLATNSSSIADVVSFDFQRS